MSNNGIYTVDSPMTTFEYFHPVKQIWITVKYNVGQYYPWLDTRPIEVQDVEFGE